jgi:signal transduction histidine kinase
MSTRGLLRSAGWMAAAGAGVAALQYRRRAHASETESELLFDAAEGLRDMSVLVAQQAEAGDIFAAVAEYVSRLAFADVVHMIRYHDDGTAVAVGGWSQGTLVLHEGDRYPVGGNNVGALVLATGRPARIDNRDEVTGESPLSRDGGVRSAVGVPVVVRGKLWGAILAGARGVEPIPRVAEERMLGFSELVAAAISSSRTNGELMLVLRQQEALRRVATLVATEAAPSAVFAVVAQEVARLFSASIGYLCSFEPDESIKVLAAWSRHGNHAQPGVRVPVRGDGAIATVYRTGRAARVDSYEHLSGPLVDVARARSAASAVASPVLVEGRLWGVVCAASGERDYFPPDMEHLLTRFAELVSAAIANTDARAQLAASRARVVAASDETRRRIERNLHDGTQQRLVTLALELRGAREGAPPELDAQLAQVEDGIRNVLEEVREIAHGLHPAILTEGGLEPALKSLARRSGLPVDLDLEVHDRLPEPVEVAAYYVVSEALTNAAKHAGASGASVGLERHNGTLRVSIRDDGVGGADPSRGSGLVGLSDRVEALGGHVEVASPQGSGTSIVVEIPVDDGASTS